MALAYPKKGYRDRLWGIAFALNEFTFAELSKDSGRPMNSTRKAVHDWVKAGYVEDTGIKKFKGRTLWRVIKGSETDIPPTYDKHGKLMKDEKTTSVDLMWRSMRKIKVFMPSDIAMYANTPKCPTSKEDASKYCQFLLAGGYLEVLHKAEPGKREAMYKLVNNTGVLAPVEKRVRIVFDQNKGEIMHTFTVGGAA